VNIYSNLYICLHICIYRLQLLSTRTIMARRAFVYDLRFEFHNSVTFDRFRSAFPLCALIIIGLLLTITVNLDHVTVPLP